MSDDNSNDFKKYLEKNDALIKHLERKIDNSEKELEAQIDEIKLEQDQIRNQQIEISNSINDLNDQTSEIKMVQDQIRIQQNKNLDDINNLEYGINKVKTEQKQISNDLNNLENQTNEIEKGQKQISNQIDDTKNGFDNISNNIRLIRDALDDLKSAYGFTISYNPYQIFDISQLSDFQKSDRNFYKRIDLIRSYTPVEVIEWFLYQNRSNTNKVQDILYRIVCFRDNDLLIRLTQKYNLDIEIFRKLLKIDIIFASLKCFQFLCEKKVIIHLNKEQIEYIICTNKVKFFKYIIENNLKYDFPNDATHLACIHRHVKMLKFLFVHQLLDPKQTNDMFRRCLKHEDLAVLGKGKYRNNGNEIAKTFNYLWQISTHNKKYYEKDKQIIIKALDGVFGKNIGMTPVLDIIADFTVNYIHLDFSDSDLAPIKEYFDRRTKMFSKCRQASKN
jgi:hypothetical protein